MASIRERAREILKVVPDPPAQIRSDRDSALFFRLTGVTHDTLRKNWEGGGIMTACNGFVGWYGAQLGFKPYLGRLDLDTFLPTIGRGYAWAKSTEEARPKYGDICLHTGVHVGVSLDFDGEHWVRADAGQGGREIGYDILRRTRGAHPYNFKNLKGWIDLELYSDCSAQSGPVSDSLLGWWKVTWRGQAYYYYFDRNRTVKYTQLPPPNTEQPPLHPDDTGTFAVEPTNAVTLRWSATGSVEKFTNLPGSGTWNGTEPQTAEAMWRLPQLATGTPSDIDGK